MVTSEIDFSDLSGKKVLSQDGMEVGEVASFNLDTDRWDVLSLVIKVDRDVLDTLNLRRPLLGTQKIIVDISEVSGVGTSIVLKSRIDDLAFSGGEPADKRAKPKASAARVTSKTPAPTDPPAETPAPSDAPAETPP
ncbi:MAG: PRC-barrel domain-containing protein, partial [Deltaproteobacteria bacterium]|nr:PRC-barrel domain-containing protein [Deltaproteobacteria bacterium]